MSIVHYGTFGAGSISVRVIWLLLFGVLCSGYAMELTAGIENYAEAINKAGRQRMLSQRITKLYTLEGLTKDSNVSATLKLQQQQEQAMLTFQRQLDELQAFSQSPLLKESLSEATMIWSEFRDVARAPVSKSGAKRLWLLDEQLLAACERVMGRLLDEAATDYNRYINLSGRQRMLSQRVAKFYMLRGLGLETPSMRESLEQAQNEFRGGLESLKSADINTGLIKLKLEEVETQWGWLVSALNIDEQAGFPIVVNDAGEKILTLMEQVTGLYESLAVPQ